MTLQNQTIDFDDDFSDDEEPEKIGISIYEIIYKIVDGSLKKRS